MAAQWQQTVRIGQKISFLPVRCTDVSGGHNPLGDQRLAKTLKASQHRLEKVGGFPLRRPMEDGNFLLRTEAFV